MSLRFWKFPLIALIGCLPMFAGAGTPAVKPNFDSLLQELQKVDQQDDAFRMVWWIPDEFWLAAVPIQKNAEDVIKALSPYVVVAVIDAKISTFGAFSYTSENDMQRSIRIFDSAGNSYAPLDAKDINADVKIIIGSMKPVLANAIGDMGKNMAFMVFPRKGKNGKPVAVSTGTGTFHIHFFDKDYDYRLPLESLSPKVKCANDPELFPISYKFCPFDGTPTVPQVQ